jgi:hypothetical protein
VSLGVMYLTSNTSNSVVARYLVTTGNYSDWYQIGATRYGIYNFTQGRGSLDKFLDNLMGYVETDANGAFTTSFFALLILLIFLSYFNYNMNFELSNPGQSLILVWILVFVLSISGLLTVSLPGANPSVEKYMVLLITSFITGGILLSKVRDNA